jgi:hypothetical protein
MDDRAADPQAIQPLLTGVLMYPLSRFTGHAQTKDWAKIPNFPNTSTGEEETKWVQPESSFDELGAILQEVPPLAGEEALYANMQSVLDAAAKDSKLHAAQVA